MKNVVANWWPSWILGILDLVTFMQASSFNQSDSIQWGSAPLNSPLGQVDYKSYSSCHLVYEWGFGGHFEKWPYAQFARVLIFPPSGILRG